MREQLRHLLAMIELQQLVFEGLTQQALGPSESAELIRDLAEGG